MSKLEIALRANKRKAMWPAFQHSFGNVVQLQLAPEQLVDVKTATNFTNQLANFVLENRKDGKLTSQNELDECATEAIIGHFATDAVNRPFLLYMSNFELFVVELDVATFTRRWKEILKFDGDTVSFASKTLDAGIAIDFYQSEIDNEWRFSVDYW